MQDFSDRTAIVTGAARGIGFAIARRLLEGGGRVVLADIDSAALEKTVGDLAQEFSSKQLAHQVVDVTDEQAVNELVSGCCGRFGGLHLLAHSAGIGLERPFLDTSAEEWRRVIDIDLTGTFLVSQAAAAAMKDEGYGRIVNLASTAGIRGGTGRAAYGAAKGGIITLTRVMAVELAEYGITVNALAPGAIETELVARMHSAQTRVTYTKAIPADRYGTPNETASAACYLLSEEARYITGHILAVDGGFLAAGVMHKND